MHGLRRVASMRVPWFDEYFCVVVNNPLVGGWESDAPLEGLCSLGKCRMVGSTMYH